jgi:hypothetical protein
MNYIYLVNTKMFENITGNLIVYCLLLIVEFFKKVKKLKLLLIQNVMKKIILNILKNIMKNKIYINYILFK